MRSERWSSKCEIENVLKVNAAGPVLKYENGKRWTHDGEGHVMLLGVTGSGKSRRGIIPIVKNIINNYQSAVIVDAKGEIFKNTRDEISDVFDLHVIDFRNLHEENEGWNPLTAPYELWVSESKKNRHIAEQMVEELAHTMYPESEQQDPFWIKEARNLFVGLVYTLFILGEPEEINLSSIYYMVAKGEERLGVSTYLKRLVDLLEDYPNVAMQLLSYVTTANDTRGGIRSTFLDGLSIATKSESVRDFLNHDDLQINHLVGDKATLIYIIIPDEIPIYDELAGVLVSQLMNHYIRVAEQDCGGTLPIKMNMILEELGNIGSAIPNLAHLMTAGRSRNIRVEFVLQSMSQLVDIYGESRSTTIVSNCDVKIAFRVNHWETLTELSRLCGEREIVCGEHISREPLITQSQLAAMETGQALVLISGRTKFVTWIPDFTEMYLNSAVKIEKTRNKAKMRENRKAGCFDIKNYVQEKNIGMVRGSSNSYTAQSCGNSSSFIDSKDMNLAVSILTEEFGEEKHKFNKEEKDKPIES